MPAMALLSPILQSDNIGSTELLIILCASVCSLAFGVLIIAGLWKLFAKAGQPGWAAIIPIYNMYILTQIVGRPAWWVILFFIPFVNFIAYLVLYLDLAASFGKGMGYGIGLVLFPYIFILLLAFGDAQYMGPKQAF